MTTCAAAAIASVAASALPWCADARDVAGRLRPHERRVLRDGVRERRRPSAAARSARRALPRRRAPGRASPRRTAATASPTKRTVSIASACCGGAAVGAPFARLKSADCTSGFTPACASSAPVTTATTPGIAFAASGIEHDDPRVRVRRAREREVALTGQREIVGELVAAGQEALVFDAANGLAAAEAGGVGVGGHRIGGLR